MQAKRLLSHTSTLLGTLLAAFAGAEEMETLTVTASRTAQPVDALALSLTAIEQRDIERVSATHIAELLNRAPGVWITRGNGQEHLTAIRSPVLTGAGSCGAFAVTEAGIPVRATGFCNVNQLFDLNTEQAQQIDIVRGPGTVLFGSDAQHGVINVINRAPASDRTSAIGLEVGANDYARVSLSHSERANQQGLRIDANAAHDGGYKDDASFDQQKVTVRHDYHGQTINARTLLSLSSLNQETAGYVAGKDAYKDEERKRENPNPGAFRDSQSVRIQSALGLPLGDGASLQVTPYARHTHMTFMMHFLPGTPVEENGHQSLGVQATYLASLTDELALTAGLDAETTRAWLTQFQVDGFSSFPAGKHYDYRVRGSMAAAFASLAVQLGQHTEVNAGLRYESLQYDYDNKMISGSTAADGRPCINASTGAEGCRYTRPDDATDRFDNVSVNLSALYQLTLQHALFTRLAQGNRAPQATEMYRLQNGQVSADLSAETLHSFEFGLRGRWSRFYYNATVFHMEKDGVIFQSADRLNLNGGKTEHRGVEYELDWQLTEHWQLSMSGTFADHHYRADVSAPGTDSALATKGNRIVSAPRALKALRLGWTPHSGTHAELEWLATGRYYTDLDNAHSYDGHNLLNFRIDHQLSERLALGAQLKNINNINYAERADFSAFEGDRYFIGEPRSLFVGVDVLF